MQTAQRQGGRSLRVVPRCEVIEFTRSDSQSGLLGWPGQV